MNHKQVNLVYNNTLNLVGTRIIGCVNNTRKKEQAQQVIVKDSLQSDNNRDTVKTNKTQAGKATHEKHKEILAKKIGWQQKCRWKDKIISEELGECEFLGLCLKSLVEERDTGVKTGVKQTKLKS